MGEVWLADDTRLGRPVALKTVRAADEEDTRGRERLLREARAAASLTHPGIAAVHDVINDNGHVVLVFEFVEGETLHTRLARGPVPIPEATDIAAQLAEALDAAHRHGIVHRDLKPANVIITPDGRVKILDFGVARTLPSETAITVAGGSTSLGDIVGTPGYAAPEQWVSGQVDARADLFALGVMLFEMVAGRRPFPGQDALALAQAMLSEDAPRLRSLAPAAPAALDDLVGSLLARDPKMRPESAHDVARALRPHPTTTHTTGETHRRSLSGRPLSRWALVSAALLLVLVVGLVGWLRQRTTSAPAEPARAPVVAVLPLNNLSGDSSRDYVAAGVADSLITSLAMLPGVTVLSRAAVAEARGRARTMESLMSDLGATLIVEGSLQQAGDRLQISLNLVRPDRSIAWAESFPGTFEQIFDLQSRLAQAVTMVLRAQVSGLGGARPVGQPTAIAAALEAYWQGRSFLERRDVQGNLDKAVSALSEAVRLDPRFGLAHAALAETYWRQYGDTRDPTWMPRAIDSSTTALRLDPGRPEVRYTLAVVLSAGGRLEEAAEELRHALTLSPNYDEARRQLGLVLAREGRIDEAVVEFQRAIALRPGYWGHYNDLGITLFNAARYVEAANAFEQLIKLQPDNYYGFQQLGAVYQTLGDNERALANYERSIAIRPSAGAVSNIGTIYYVRGEYAQAVDAYKKAVELRPNEPDAHRNLGDAYRRLGRRSDARAAYRAAVELAEGELKVNPTNADTLSSLGVYLAKAGDLEGARERIERAITLAPQDVRVWYRAAVVHALAGRTAAALAALKKAIDGGYSQSVMAAEEDFESLRRLSEFRSLLTSPQHKGAPQ
jgi:serine/threonine-protein kinase